ncbi:MAG: TolC family protein, partial [Bacteroidota bacterium]|nr:TolC family protein [Bacteroidota bacterium]
MKLSLKNYIPLVLFVMISCSINAQDTLQHKYTLQQCVDLAIQNNLDIKNAEYRMQSNDVNAQQAKAIAIPSLSANITHGINQGKSINPYT